ncbi:hypothetical protein Slala04_63660 [Streptomyces lavendulae subsp. lavendulae]|nr:hypothetical protein Slala04_63660 [Streptomyces lavendulae subsp. lavendulae]
MSGDLHTRSIRMITKGDIRARSRRWKADRSIKGWRVQANWPGSAPGDKGIRVARSGEAVCTEVDAGHTGVRRAAECVHPFTSRPGRFTGRSRPGHRVHMA